MLVNPESVLFESTLPETCVGNTAPKPSNSSSFGSGTMVRLLAFQAETPDLVWDSINRKRIDSVVRQRPPIGVLLKNTIGGIVFCLVLFYRIIVYAVDKGYAGSQ